MRPTPAANLVRVAGVTLLILWSLGPIVMGVMTSMSTQPETQQVPARWIPEDPTLDNYRALLGGEKISSVLPCSMIWPRYMTTMRSAR